jgi:hypothetical protein
MLDFDYEFVSEFVPGMLLIRVFLHYKKNLFLIRNGYHVLPIEQQKIFAFRSYKRSSLVRTNT